MGLNTVLFNQLNIGMGHSAMVVVYAAQRQRSLYIETRMVEESFPTLSCTELRRNSNSDTDFVQAMTQ